MSNNRKYIPARLHQARISRGLSMVELASEIGVTRQAISQYEIGTIEPSEAVMRRIVDILDYPLDFFRKPMLNINADFSQSVVYYRKRVGTSMKLKIAAEERITQFCEIDEYFKRYVDFPEVDILRMSTDNYIDSSNNIDVEHISKDLREYWNLGTEPISNLAFLLEKKGFRISTMRHCRKKIEAFSQWYKNGTPYIFYGSEDQSALRLRFDLAHELGHLIMHTHITEEDMKNKEIYNKIEDEANRFAGAFLLPATSFVLDIYSTSIDHFLLLKKKWKVSLSAMIYRAEELGLFTASQITYLKNQMTSCRYWHKEPYDDDMQIERPVAHKQSLELLVNNNIITKSEFLRANPYHPEELEAMCFLDKGYLQDTLKSSNSKVIRLKF